LDGIAQMDTWFGFAVPFTSYYAAMISSLQTVGFVAGKTLFGAPYDWRFPTSYHELDDLGFFDQFKQLIETVYTSNGNTKVYIVTHSLGGPTSVAFFEYIGTEWVQEHIAAFLPISAPWAGTGKALRTVISGDDFGINVFGISLLSKAKVAQAAKNLGGLIEQIPDASFWGNTRTFVTKGAVNFTALQFEDLFVQAGYPVTSVIVNRTQGILARYNPPRLPVYCMYGTNTPTEIGYAYDSFSSQPVRIDYDNMGDGTVNLESLNECSEWSQTQPEPVTVKEFDMRDHSSILEDQELFDYLISILSGSV